MIDIRFIQSMLARNKTEIYTAEILVRELEFRGASFGIISRWKKQIAKLAEIQIALKAEVSRQKWAMRFHSSSTKGVKKHGKNDSRYIEWAINKRGAILINSTNGD